jgi:aminomethyltransferase
MVDFNGWWLPVQYAGILEEHRSVRERAGLFDVSHMGEIRVVGKDAETYMQKLVTNDVASLQPGKVRYSPMCYPDGGTVDDILIYRIANDEFWLVVNASNKDKDFAWMNQNVADLAVQLVDESDETAEIALQGPRSAAILEKTSAAADVSGLSYYEFWPRWNIAGATVLVSRTGYTGEDGFEIYCHPSEVTRIWDALLAAGAEFGLQPAGLGCRDTLRFEAAMPLYGHELSAEITPLEAGLGKFVAFEKNDFNGKQALLEQREAGHGRKLIGFAMTERGVARAGYPVIHEGKVAGFVTSGSVAPSLGENLGMALVDRNIGSVGTEIAVEIREKPVAAKIVTRPFYRRRI